MTFRPACALIRDWTGVTKLLRKNEKTMRGKRVEDPLPPHRKQSSEQQSERQEEGLCHKPIANLPIVFSIKMLHCTTSRHFAQHTR